MSLLTLFLRPNFLWLKVVLFALWPWLAGSFAAATEEAAKEKEEEQKSVVDIMVSWHLRHFYEPFSTVTKDSKRLTAADRQAMRDMVEVYALYDGMRDLLGPKLFDAYHVLRNNMDAVEPVFVFLHFWRFDVFPGRYTSNLKDYEEIVKAMRERKDVYAPAVARCVVQIWRETYISLKSSDQYARLEELDQLALDLQMEAIAHGDYLPGEEYVLLEHLISDPLMRREGNYRWFEANWQRIAPLIAASEKVHPAVKKTIAGYAALMQKNYAAAERLLEEAWQLRPDLPQVPALMLKVFEERKARGGLMELKARQWFKRGLAARPDSILVNWNYVKLMGDIRGEMLDIPFLLHLGKAFAEESNKQSVMHKFAVFRVYLRFKGMKPTAEMREALREVIQTELRRLDAVKDRGKTHDWRISMAHLVLMSWLLEDYAGGKSYAVQLGKDAFPDWDYVWFNWLGTDRERAFAECYLFGGASLDAVDYRKAMALYDAKKYQEVGVLLPALREKYGKVTCMEKWLKEVADRAARPRR